MALVPEHNLPGLVHAHHMASRVAPGHGVDSSAEETEAGFRGVGSWPCPFSLDLGCLRPSLSPSPHL